MTKTIEQLEDELKSLNETRESLFAQMKPLERKLGTNYNQIERVKNLLSEKKFAAATTGDVNWDELLVLGNGNNGKTGYDLLEKLLAEIGLRGNGYWPETEQRAIQISVADDASDDDIDQKVKGIETLLPHIKPVDCSRFDVENGKLFDLMENTLSQYGSYSVVYDVDNDKWKLCIEVYRRPRVVAELNTLRELLVYIRQEHPYPRNKSATYAGDDYFDDED